MSFFYKKCRNKIIATIDESFFNKFVLASKKKFVIKTFLYSYFDF